MIKVIAVGDLHADFPKLWRALKNSYAVGEDWLPSDPLRRGTYRVVVMGDLVHPKLLADYRRLTGLEDYDPNNPDHLRMAARAQIRELMRIKRFQEAAPEHITILMGNHDHAVLYEPANFNTAAERAAWPMPMWPTSAAQRNM